MRKSSAAVAARAGRRGEVDGDDRRVALHQHRDAAGALGGLAGAAPRVLGDVGGGHDGDAVGAVGGGVAQRSLEAVHTAQARLLELRGLDVPRQRRPAAGDQLAVHEAADDHRRRRRVVGSGLGPDRQVADPLGINVVIVDQPQHRVGGHGVGVVVGPDDAEAVADDGARLVPGVAGPLAPVLQAHAKRRYEHRETADPYRHVAHHISAVRQQIEPTISARNLRGWGALSIPAGNDPADRRQPDCGPSPGRRSPSGSKGATASGATPWAISSMLRATSAGRSAGTR